MPDVRGAHGKLLAGDQSELHSLQLSMFNTPASFPITKSTNQIVFNSVLNRCKQVPNRANKSWEVWLKQETIYVRKKINYESY